MKVVLTIAGSDSCGGAGIQADLKTFEAFGIFGASAITVLTAQNTKGVRAIEALPATFIQQQIQAVLDDFDVAAIKVGMLYNAETIRAVREILQDLSIPVVVDPVFISKAGSKLLEDDAIEELKTLFRFATVLTPNLYEAKELFGYVEGESASLETIKNAPYPIVLKHTSLEMPEGFVSIDQLFKEGRKYTFESPALETKNLQGTGCSFSSAIAANLALGKTLEESIEIAKKFIYKAILHAPGLGHGAGVIAHKKGGLDA